MNSRLYCLIKRQLFHGKAKPVGISCCKKRKTPEQERKMTAKRITAAVLAAAITLSVSACNNTTYNREKSPVTQGGGNIAIGEYVKFGDYNWQVLDVKNGSALILSERILDYRPYNNLPAETTWAECDLRAYAAFLPKCRERCAFKKVGDCRVKPAVIKHIVLLIVSEL